MNVKPLPARYRLARNVEKGMEVQYEGGQWVRVDSALHIQGPVKVSSFGLANGCRTSAHPGDHIMCRRLAVGDDDA